jgi:hypothetical protein
VRSQNAVDLLARIGVEIGHGTDGADAAAQTFDQKLLRAGIVGQPFLGKDAELDIQSPRIVARQLLDGLEPDHADAGIKLHMRAHARRPVRNAALQGLLAARINVLDREISLGARGLPDRLGDGTLLDPAAVQDAGLVEMDVRLDHPGHDKATGRVDLSRVGL